MKFCTQCDIRLNVLKTRERSVITMNTGPFIAHETILYCPQHGEIHRSKNSQHLLPFKGAYGYDVLVHVGKALYLLSMNEQAIKKELKLKAINISESEIRYLGQKCHSIPNHLSSTEPIEIQAEDGPKCLAL